MDSRKEGAKGGSDEGWVDYLQWTGSGGSGGSSGWEEIAYVYDPAGRRIEKQVDGTTQVKYVYDRDSCIAEYDGSNSLLRKYIQGPAIDEPICMVEVADANAVSYYHFDALGSVIALSDDSGDTEQVYEYSVYGQVAASDPNHPNRFMFTGREFDADTGLYYYRARYYNPYIGRFLQTDPVGYGDGMNWYAYCRNNATNCVDPSGKVGRFLDSANGKLRYEAENGEIIEFDDLGQWMDWFELDVHSNGYDVSELAGYGMAGGDDNLNTRLLWNIQAMIALGYDADKIRAIDAGGVTISVNSNHDLYYDDEHRVAHWDPSGDVWTHEDQAAVGGRNQPHWVGFPALALLAHELEHGYQDITGNLVGFGHDMEVTKAAEQGAMMAENEMAYAFYKKVPGYGEGELRMIAGPRTFYKASGMSEEYAGKRYDDATMAGMKWIDWTEDYVPAY